ncbi:MAG: hypothetical protein HQK52_19535 [Oligoflexia bacterium]|nr:hypothetical protein [Oligoflexia bacterium]
MSDVDLETSVEYLIATVASLTEELSSLQETFKNFSSFECKITAKQVPTRLQFTQENTEIDVQFPDAITCMHIQAMGLTADSSFLIDLWAKKEVGTTKWKIFGRDPLGTGKIPLEISLVEENRNVFLLYKTKAALEGKLNLIITVF